MNERLKSQLKTVLESLLTSFLNKAAVELLLLIQKNQQQAFQMTESTAARNSRIRKIQKM